MSLCSCSSVVMPREYACASVGERHGPGAGELQQRRRTLELGVLDQLVRVQLTLLEADRADVELTPLLDELRVQPFGWRVLVRADRIGVAAEAEPHAGGGQPHHDFLALVECRAGG